MQRPCPWKHLYAEKASLFISDAYLNCLQNVLIKFIVQSYFLQTTKVHLTTLESGKVAKIKLKMSNGFNIFFVNDFLIYYNNAY